MMLALMRAEQREHLVETRAELTATRAELAEARQPLTQQDLLWELQGSASATTPR